MKSISYAAIMLMGACVMTGCGKAPEANRVAPVKVKVEKMRLQPINGTQDFSGTVEEESGSLLSFLAGGTIRQLFVSQGQMVQRGALLGVIDETSLQSAYEIALATRHQAEDAYARMKQLHDNNSLPEVQWVDVQSKLKQAVAAEQIARKALSDSKLYAPYSGFIAEKTAEVGQNTMPGVPVMRLVKIDRVKVKIAVPENEIAHIKKGDEMKIQVTALGSKVFVGKVTEKGITAHPLSRSYDVKVLVENAAHELLPGMVCNVCQFNTGKSATAIVLPAKVIALDSDNKEFVWVGRQGKAAKQFVTTGGQTAAGVIITSGLNEDEEVIVEGQQKVSEGMSIATDN